MAKHQSPDCRVGIDRRPAVQALEVILQLLSDRRVALRADHVIDRLVGDEAADGSDQGWVPELLANLANLRQNLSNAVLGAVMLGEPVDILKHEARHLVTQDVGVDTVRERTQVGGVLPLQPLQFQLHLDQLLKVQAGVVIAPGEGCHHALGGRLGGAPGKRRECGVDYLRPSLDRRHVCHRSHPARAVAVNHDRQLNRLLERGDQLPGDLRREQPGGVLDHDRVDPEVAHALRQRAPEIHIVGRADGVAESALDHLLRPLRGPDRAFHIAHVVERIEDAEDVDPGGGGVLDEELDRVVGVVTVADQILATNEGLDRGVRSRLAKAAQVVPRVLTQPQITLEGGPAESLHRVEANRVHALGERKNLVRQQATTEQGLVAVPKAGVGQAQPWDRPPPVRHRVARPWRSSRCRAATCSLSMPRIRALSQAAFFAPASPIATVATGIPAGICTME